MAAKEYGNGAKGAEETRPGQQPVVAPEQPEETPPPAVPVESKPGRPGPPVAGIGASAGGLDPFKKFFGAMPADSGVACVLIPHLDPKHGSLMVELLTRCTPMPVVEAGEGMAVEANHVYIIPPNKYMTISGGVLRLTGPVERGGLQTSIDLFLRSLATDKQEKAVCIILSGTGSHGALGLKAVKAEGGMAMVQDPSTAEYARMPQSAIATGLADYVLPVEKMPEALIKYVQHDYVYAAKPSGEETEAPDHLNQVLALLRAGTKFDFRSYRKNTLTRRIERRMSLSHFNRSADYIAFLREHPDEVNHLSRDLLISVTSFFRDPEAFQALETEVIAPLVRAKQSDAPVRVWSTGCATGEEPYSLGILLLEQLAATRKSCPVQIFATEVDEAALEVARPATYPESISADVSAERLGRFFTRADDSSYQVGKHLREIVVFARQNLIADAPFSKIDLVVCRNLLIYLEPDVQKRVVSLLHFSLNEGGFLFLGPSETIGRHVDLFEPVSKKWRIYRRIGPSRPGHVEFPITAATDTLVPDRRSPPRGATRPVGFADMTHRLLLDQFAPAAVLITRKYEILYVFGPTNRYLAGAAGEPTQDLMAMAGDGLRTRLRSAIHKAVRENCPVILDDAGVKRNDGYHPVLVTIRPVQGPRGEDGLLLVTFQDGKAPPFPAEGGPGEGPPPETGAGDAALRRLEAELKATRADLQRTIEEMESSNEELKAANEEVMSMNEELQSANEELETSKEELQSLNEELGTVNNQLRDKVEELGLANNDMANLLNCTEVAILFLDKAFRIKRYTPPATRLFNLTATDLGRPIGDITPKYSDGTLRHDIEQVLRSFTPRKMEFQTPDGGWWIQRITLYRTLDLHVEGVVLTFTDVTQVRRADEQTRRLATVLRDSNDAVIVHDFEGRISAWNRGAEQMYGYSEAEALQLNAWLKIPEDVREEDRGYWELLRRGEGRGSWEIKRKTKDGRILDVWVTATLLRDEVGRPVAIARTERDITDRKQAEAALREREESFRGYFDNVTVGTAQIDAAGRFFRVNDRFCGITGYQREELLGGMGPLDLDHPEDREADGKRVADFRRGKASPYEMEKRYVRKDGVVVWVHVSAAPVRGANGTVRYTAGVIEDITDRKMAEAAVENARAILQSVLDTAPVGVVFADADGKITLANDALREVFGGPVTGDAYGPRGGYRLCRMDGSEIGPAELPLPRAVRDGVTSRDVEILVKRDDGSEVVALAAATPLRSADGMIWGATAVLQDITTRKVAEEALTQLNATLEQQIADRTQALREREERLRAILNTAADAIVTFDVTGIIQSVNPAAEWMFGYTTAEMIGRNVKVLVAPPYRDVPDRWLDRSGNTAATKVMSTGREVVAQRKDGSTFPVDLAVSAVGQLRLYTGILRDITRRKELEREVVDVASQEQRRIGQDLHDSVGQELTALNILAGDLAEALRADPSNGSKLVEQMVRGLKRSQQELRAVMRGLLPVAVDTEGLMAALSDLAVRTRQGGMVTCTFDCPDPVAVADNLTATHLFLIAQEAVHNAVKHARPRTIRIALAANDLLFLSVQDDGIGMPAQPTETRGGLGLRIMQNRAAIVGATLTIQPAEPAGTLVTCVLLGKNHDTKSDQDPGPGSDRR
ncbi:MAG: methyltransferase/methylesterase, CheR/CheB with sensor [Gemmataceae bacterium]|nr:methyltransferase/methylesterase, CheR/CheB with sensor [Gemmataceae bacterium]